MGAGGKEGAGFFGEMDEALFGEEAVESDEQNRLFDESRRLLAEAAPLRQALMDRSMGFLETGDISQSPQFQAAKAINASALQNALGNIRESAPTGGGLTQALTDAEIQNAIAMTVAGGDIAESELNRAMQLGLGATGMGSQMLSSAGNLANQIAISNNERRTSRENNWQEMWKNIGSFWGGAGAAGA